MTAPLDDLDEIMAVMIAAFDPAFGEAWTRRQVENALLVGNCHYLLADVAGENPEADKPVAGFCLSRTGIDEEELLLFAVAPDHRQRGVGRRLLQRFAATASLRGVTRLLLEMRKGNPAERLYRRSGFRPIGERPKYYRTPSGEWIDAITFATDIKPG